MVDWLWTVVDWSFHLFERDHSKSRIFEMMEKFQNDCTHPRTKNLFKNSCSRQLRFVNAMVALITSGSDRLTDRNLFFFPLKLLIFRWWWQLWMKTTTIKQTYWMNVFFVVFCLFVLLPNLMSTVKHLLSGHLREWAYWLLNRSWPLNRGFPKCIIKYGRPIEGLHVLAHRKPLSLLCYVYHVFDELLKETGHGARIIVLKCPEIIHCN